MALTKVKFSKRADVAEMSGSSFKDESRVELNNGDRYEVSSTDLGFGVLLASGNYANRVNELTLDTTVIHTGGGELTAGGITNQIQDSDTGYLIPLDSSVQPNTILVIEVQEWKADQTPVATTQGGDLIDILGGTDSSITWVGSAKVTLTSSGAGKWRL